eukprot:1157956-Pelagomonas_calceolata.AAC.1
MARYSEVKGATPLENCEPTAVADSRLHALLRLIRSRQHFSCEQAASMCADWVTWFYLGVRFCALAFHSGT